MLPLLFTHITVTEIKELVAGLGNIQKVRDGEPLGSRMNAKDEFDAVDGEDDFLA